MSWILKDLIASQNGGFFSLSYLFTRHIFLLLCFLGLCQPSHAFPDRLSFFQFGGANYHNVRQYHRIHGTSKRQFSQPPQKLIILSLLISVHKREAHVWRMGLVDRLENIRLGVAILFWLSKEVVLQVKVEVVTRGKLEFLDSSGYVLVRTEPFVNC